MNEINKEHENVAEKPMQFSKGVVWLFLAVSILSLIYAYYRSGFELHVSFYKYYIIFTAGAFFWGVVLRLREEIRANIVLVATSLLVGLYLMEIILYFLGYGYFSIPTRQWTSIEQGVELDAHSTKLQVIRNLRNGGVDAFPALQPFEIIQKVGSHKVGAEFMLPFGGVSKKTTVFCNEGGEYIIYLADRYGFNNPDSEWDQVQIEWLLTGDSFTHGACIQPDNNIAGQIRSLTGESVINLGIIGNSPLIELAVLKEYAELIKPKKVLWIYFEGNDLSGLHVEKTSPLLMKYLQPEFSQNLIYRQKEIDSMLVKYITEAEIEAEIEAILLKTRWLRLYSIRKLIGFIPDVGVDANVEPLFTEILKKARDRTEKWGGKLYFVYLPAFDRYANAKYDYNLYRKRSEVIDVVKGLHIPVIDIHQEVFVDYPDRLSLFTLRTFGHYSDEGYGEVAKAIVEGVRD